jgi:hypothetical protein
MLNINYLDIDLEKAKEDHLNYFELYIRKKIKGLKRFPFFYQFLLHDDNLKNIIVGTPDVLIELNYMFRGLININLGIEEYETYISLSNTQRKNCKTSIAKFIEEVETIFKYKLLSEENHYNSYDLTSNLQVRSCIYCNRNYTITHRKENEGRLMNPQLDHWFPQSKYPLLQISFYNLIPSCDICNSRVKKDVLFNLEQHFHPYQVEQEKIHFSYYPTALPNKYRICFDQESDEKIKRVSEAMCIDEMYNAHIPELEDLLLMKQIYSQGYFKTLKNAFPLANINDNDVYRLIFGTEINENKFHLRPLSKFKHDIINRKK